MSQPVLVMGARGRVGREVVAALVSRGVETRALVRRPSDRAQHALVTDVVADLRDPSSLRQRSTVSGRRSS